MNSEKSNQKKVAEPATDYKSAKPKQGIGKDFDFDNEFAKGLTAEEAKAEMHRRIKLWKWEK